MAVSNELLAVKESAVAEFLSTEQPVALAALAASTHPKHNVTAVGAGPKLVNGQPSGADCVRLYVERKVAEAAIPPEFVLPKQYRGYPTDVIESGEFVAGHPGAAAVDTQAATSPRTRMRPAHPGCSVGFRFPNNPGTVMAGTFGALVSRQGAVFILSNNHVLADENNLPAGSPIFQPGLLDGGNAATDQIAALTQFIPINPAAPNDVDCAIAQLTRANLADPRFLPNVGSLRSAAPSLATVGMQVEKVGRTSGFSTGQIFDIHATVKVRYSVGLVVFQDQVLVRAAAGSFSAAGDSGSLIVDAVNKQPTALLFAGSPAFTIGNKIEKVFAALGVTLVI